MSDVVVHVDCEDDTEQRPSSMLPLRGRIESQVLDMIAQVYGTTDLFRRLTLHYLGGKVHLELWLAPPDGMNIDIADGAAEFRRALETIDNVGSITLLTEVRLPTE